MNVRQLLAKKKQGEKIVMITAYDYASALIAEQSDIDIVLVGDSLGNVVLGYDNTTPVTMEDMLHHTKPVARVAKKALVVADMPFGSYQISRELALHNAVRLIKEGGAAAVKLEGGKETAPLIAALTRQGIPVMAHIGLLPQTTALWQGFRYQGRDAVAARRLLETAHSLAQAGAFALVLECVASEAAAQITERLAIPTIGIGAGPHCDGQVLVFHDLIGLNEQHRPSFVKQYGQVAADMRAAVQAYATEVKSGAYPAAEHSFFMEPEEFNKL